MQSLSDAEQPELINHKHLLGHRSALCGRVATKERAMRASVSLLLTAQIGCTVAMASSTPKLALCLALALLCCACWLLEMLPACTRMHFGSRSNADQGHLWAGHSVQPSA
jgi:hypothetical protein